MCYGGILLDFLLAVVALGVLVAVHETGHFLVALLCKIKVEAFSIGFGKPLIKFTRHEIEYRLGWIPLGGYVKMKGENLEEDATPSTDSFLFAPWWKKALIGFAGPFANLLFGLLIFILTFAFPGKTEDQRPVVGKSNSEYSLLLMPGDSIMAVNGTPVQGWYQFLAGLKADKPNEIKLARQSHRLTLTIPQVKQETFANAVLPAVPAIVGEVSPGMAAWNAGLKAGDIITNINGYPVSDWYEMRDCLQKTKLDTVLVTIRRGNNVMDRKLPLQVNPLAAGQRLIGITQVMPVSYAQSYTPKEALLFGFRSTENFIVLNYVGLYKLLSKPEQLKNSLGGPVMIVTMSNQSVHKGWNYWISFIAAISLLLMIMNLLPIPVLDGGLILFAFIQAIIGKPIPRKVQIVAQNIGMILLFALMLYAFYNDFTKVFARALSSAGMH